MFRVTRAEKRYRGNAECIHIMEGMIGWQSTSLDRTTILRAASTLIYCHGVVSSMQGRDAKGKAFGSPSLRNDCNQIACLNMITIAIDMVRLNAESPDPQMMHIFGTLQSIVCNGCGTCATVFIAQTYWFRSFLCFAGHPFF